jgi:hypothetical protein
MEGRVSVNDDSDPSWEPAQPDGPESLVGGSMEASHDVDPAWLDELGEPPEPAADVSHGPCLYLGPSGERCSKPALAGDYCTRHHPDPEKRWPSRSYKRVLLASIALVAILWPYFQDAVQLLARVVRELGAN